MAIRYVPFDGHSVSYEWSLALNAARKAGVKFTLDSGHRTMAEQQVLWNNYQRTGYPKAAYPSPTAPHIRVGRWDHALDIDSNDGGTQRLANWLRSKGVPMAWTVSGEPWHIEAQGVSSRAMRRKFTPKLTRKQKWEAELDKIRAEVRRRKAKGSKNPWRGFRLRAKALEYAIKVFGNRK